MAELVDAKYTVVTIDGVETQRLQYRFESCPDYKKIKIMKKEKTYFDGIMFGFVITAIIYSVLLCVVIRMLTQ